MQKRNFYISVVSACIAITCVWLSVYNFVRLDINPFEYAQDSFLTLVEGEEDDDETIVVIKGKVSKELRLSMSEIKSGKYHQVKDKLFKIVTRVEPHYYVYSGATLWSILETENILKDDATTFTFVGADGYESPKPLSIDDVAKKYESDVILAYEYDGDPIYQDGPIRSVIDDDACPDEYSSQYSVKNLVEIRIG
ncbi:MAG: molybdopterin-dependent oxidoreductase [Candidatus Thorarchaeota archaeon]